MLIRLISLVFLFTFFNKGIVFSVENNDFIYPLDKPSVFKKAKIIKNLSNKEIIPQKKPIDKKIKQEKIITKEKK